MPKLPSVTGAELVRALGKMGFRVVRQRASHVQVRKDVPDGRSATFPIPVHAGRTLKTGTLHGILRLAGVTPEELAALL